MHVLRQLLDKLPRTNHANVCVTSRADLTLGGQGHPSQCQHASKSTKSRCDCQNSQSHRQSKRPGRYTYLSVTLDLDRPSATNVIDRPVPESITVRGAIPHEFATRRRRRRAPARAARLNARKGSLASRGRPSLSSLWPERAGSCPQTRCYCWADSQPGGRRCVVACGTFCSPMLTPN